jgi:dTDP-4-dehydrorhamnose reductase
MLGCNLSSSVLGEHTVKPHVLLLGSAGQLGVELGKMLPAIAEVTALARQQVDITNEKSLRNTVRAARPDFIVNAAAYTAVDKAETDRELAFAVNRRAPQILAEEALGLNAWLIHFSTDYVFDGSGHTPWKETDATNPLNVYGLSKLEGEQVVAATGCRHLIFRTSWVYAAHGQNFLQTMLRLRAERPKLSIVNDQIGAPTSAKELSQGVLHVLGRMKQQEPESGIYHMSCGGETSWYGFAQAIFCRATGQIPELIPITTEQYPTPALRPHYSVLNGDKLAERFSLRLEPWETALAQVMEESGI